MAKKLQLQVPTPCHENWGNMTPTQRGRFCTSCQKQVIDFSNKSDREIAMFFKKPSTGSVCGRFMEDQLNRDIVISKKRIPWLKYFFQIAIPTFLASGDHRSQGKIQAHRLSVAPISTNQETSKQACTTTMGMMLSEITLNKDTISSAAREDTRPKTDTVIQRTDQIIESEPELTVGDVSFSIKEDVVVDSLESIKGKVVDEDGNPVPFATIMIKGTKDAATTDVNGLFGIYPKSEWKDIALVIAAVGFNTAEMQIKDEGSTDLGNIILIPMKFQLSGEVLVMGDTVAKTEKKKPIPILPQIFKDTAFKKFSIYPNPIQSNSALNIVWKQNQFGDYLLQLFNQSGQLVFSKEINISEGSNLFTINMPSVIAGNYFLKLTGESSGRSYTEKLIVK